MNQDGKLDPAPARRTDDTPTGKIMLTLCTPLVEAPGYHHAMIPFPASYEAACAEALKTFVAYLPASVEAVSLRQAVRRMDGECVWSIIREDAWDTVLKREGEELGVFLPDASPERFGYKKLVRRLVSFNIRYGAGSYSLPLIYPVGSLKDCENIARTIKPRKWHSWVLSFDQRLVGTQAQKADYRDMVNIGSGSSGKEDPILCPLDDSELFDLLMDLHPKGMSIYMSRPGF